MRDQPTVAILIFSDSVKDKVFTTACQNPGVGGTQYVSIQLALCLANKFPRLRVQLVNHCDILIREKYDNLQVKKAENINLYFADLQAGKSNCVLIAPSSVLSHAHTAQLKSLSKRIIAWIHHPFRFDFRLRDIVAHVHVGSYQYYSNSLFYKHNWLINNLFSLPPGSIVRTAPKYGSKLRLVFLGALVKAKGFLHVARQWTSMKNLFHELELHVIGSSETYGRKIEHPLIPCDNDFANQILDLIPAEDIINGSVVFHGNLGEEKFDILHSAHFALLNPTGTSEAFPASPLECMACGLPVIASDDYGMSDSMRYFPELIISRPEDIPKRIDCLLSDSYAYKEVSLRCIAVASWYDSQTESNLFRWMRLIEKVANDAQQSFRSSPPLLPIYGSKRKWRFRQLKAFFNALIRPIRGR